MSFYLSKFLWSFINPFNILLIFIFIGILFHWLLKYRIYKLFYFIALIIFIFTAVMPTGNLLFYLLEKNYQNQELLPKKVNGILVLSGATNPGLSREYNQIHLNDSVERLTESIKLIQIFPESKVIFSGGSGSITNVKLTHAAIAKNFYKQLNVNTKKIIFEDKSRNTYENILFSFEIAKPQEEENWILITSAFHMNRAMNIAEKIDWKLIPYAVDFKTPKSFSWSLSFAFFSNLSDFQYAAHEWTGLIAYYFMGRTNKIF